VVDASQVSSFCSRTAQRAAELNLLTRQINAEQRKVQELKAKHGQLEKVRALLNAVIESRKQETLGKLEQIVTVGLRAVFGDSSYSFHVEPVISRKQVAYRFRLDDATFSGDDILESRAGGVMNVIGFLLSVSIQLMLDPKSRFFVRDERLVNVSPEYGDNVCSLIRTIADKMDVQFLLISPYAQFIDAADVAYRLARNPQGETEATKVR
jgi:hypothetical protein